MKVHFTDYFAVDPTVLHAYGAFNVSLVNDLPLFVDPFLLFNSARSEYRALHDDIIQYVRFLRDKSAAGALTEGLLRAWFTFPEVKQTWLGFSGVGNAGAGLGMKFARTLNRNLGKLLTNFGAETITKGSHLEKLCLIDDGVGRDLISDFVTNLIKGYLLRYTQAFARGHLTDGQRRTVAVDKVAFNYETETWAADRFELPYVGDDYVLLTPRDLLTRDDAWINRSDLVREFDDIVASVPDGQLRAQFNNYLASRLPKLPRGKERRRRRGPAGQYRWWASWRTRSRSTGRVFWLVRQRGSGKGGCFRDRAVGFCGRMPCGSRFGGRSRAAASRSG